MTNSKKKLTEADYQKLGQTIENIYETGYAERSRIYKMSFIKGLMAGFGGVIGATIIVALVLWVLSLFNTIPIIGPFVEKVQETVDTQPN